MKRRHLWLHLRSELVARWNGLRFWHTPEDELPMPRRRWR